jgi:TRAP-type C4-dicarboxylate transport system substrate-binding protein
MLKRRNILLTLIILIILTASLIGCQTGRNQVNEQEGTATAEETIYLRYSGPVLEGHHVSQMQKWFTEEVKERTGGRVEIEPFFGGELYDQFAGMDAVNAGALDMALNGLELWGGYNPATNLFGYLFTVTNLEHWLEIRDDVHVVLEPLFEKMGVKLLHYIPYGELAMCFTKTDVKAIEDIKGLKIRAPGPAHLKSVEILGAVPTSLALTEVYDALAKGSLDGVISGWSTIFERKFCEPAKLSVGPISYPPWICFMNLDVWNSLPKDVQEIIQEVSIEAEEFAIKGSTGYDEKMLEELENYGDVYYFTPEEIAQWTEHMKEAGGEKWMFEEEWLAECKKAGFEKEAKELLEIVSRN